MDQASPWFCGVDELFENSFTDFPWGFLTYSYLKYALISKNTAIDQAYAKPVQWLVLKWFIGSSCQKFNLFWPDLLNTMSAINSSFTGAVFSTLESHNHGIVTV